MWTCFYYKRDESGWLRVSLHYPKIPFAMVRRCMLLVPS